jgi:hypothetical protein
MRSSVSSTDTMVIFEGYLEKLSSSPIQKWQSRYFQIAAHYLRYYEKKGATTDELLKGVVDLVHVKEVLCKDVELHLLMLDGTGLKV